MNRTRPFLHRAARPLPASCPLLRHFPEVPQGLGATGSQGGGLHGDSAAPLYPQCSASEKEASGRGRSKVASAGSPRTAWRKWPTAHRRASKVRRGPGGTKWVLAGGWAGWTGGLGNKGSRSGPLPPTAESRSDKAKRLFRHYTVGSYDSFDAPR